MGAALLPATRVDRGRKGSRQGEWDKEYQWSPMQGDSACLGIH